MPFDLLLKDHIVSLMEQMKHAMYISNWSIFILNNPFTFKGVQPSLFEPRFFFLARCCREIAMAKPKESKRTRKRSVKYLGKLRFNHLRFMT